MSQKLQHQDVSREQKAILLFMPHMIGLAFMLKHVKAAGSRIGAIANDPGMIACTDGTTVWYGETYEKIEQSGRNYIFLHEMMHGIFRHSTRIKLIQLTKGTVFPVLANYAADAIINEAINEEQASKTTQFAMPKDFPGITMRKIHEIIKEAADKSGETPPTSYDKEARLGLQMEIIYDWLVWAYDAMRRKRNKDAEKQQGQKGQPGKGSPGAGGGAESEGSGGDESEGSGSDDKDQQKDSCPGSGKDVPADEAEIERIVREEKAWDLEEAVEELRRLIESGANINDLIAKANGEIDDARAKIQAVIQGLKMQGMGQGNMLLALENDLPPPVVPWNHILRKVITRDLGTKMDDSYTRLGCSTRAALSMGRRAPYQPGTTIFTERPRVLVVLDVSGSHISQLKQCFSEIWSIAQKKNAAVDVITFDDGVQQKIEIRTKQDFRKILEAGITGGGGTCLANVFAEAKKLRTPYRACVIMTDGYLSPPGETNGIGIVWMVTPGGTTKGLEGTGQIINMPDYMGEAEKKAA